MPLNSYKVEKSKAPTQKLYGFGLTVAGFFLLIGEVNQSALKSGTDWSSGEAWAMAAKHSWILFFIVFAGLKFLSDGFIQQTLLMTERKMVIENRLFGFAWTRGYPLEHVREFRHVRGFSFSEGRLWDWLAFYVKGKNVRFAEGIGDSQAESVVAWVRETYPQAIAKIQP